MTKKRLIIILVAIATICGIITIFNLTQPKAPVGEKTLYITLIDKTTDTILINKEEYHTSSNTLGEFLNEQHPNLHVVLSDHGFGRSIDEINGLIGDLQNANGPWIMYYSTNNLSCVNNGYCLGVDDLPIYDLDDFEFHYTQEALF